MIGRYIDDIAADARPTLACYSADTRPILGGYIDRDIDRQSTVSRSTYRPLPSIEAPYKTQDPNRLYPSILLILRLKLHLVDLGVMPATT